MKPSNHGQECHSYTRWILTKRGNSTLPPEEILHKLESIFSLSNSASKICECTGTIHNEDYDSETVSRKITDLINQTYDISEKDNIYKVEISEKTEETKDDIAESEQGTDGYDF